MAGIMDRTRFGGDRKPSLVAAFGDKVGLACVAAGTNQDNLSLLTPATGRLSTVVDVCAGSSPQLLWDGNGLHLSLAETLPPWSPGISLIEPSGFA